MDLIPGAEGNVEKIDTLVKQMVNGAVSKRTPNQLLVTLPLTETPSFSRSQYCNFAIPNLMRTRAVFMLYSTSTIEVPVFFDAGLFESLESIDIATGKTYASMHSVLAYGIGM